MYFSKCLPSTAHTQPVCLPTCLSLYPGVLPYAGTQNLIFWLRNTYIGTIPNVLGEDFEGNVLRVVLFFLQIDVSNQTQQQPKTTLSQMDFANGLFLQHSILLIFSIYLCAILKKTDGKTQQSQITLWVGRELKNFFLRTLGTGTKNRGDPFQKRLGKHSLVKASLGDAFSSTLPYLFRTVHSALISVISTGAYVLLYQTKPKQWLVHFGCLHDWEGRTQGKAERLWE